MEKQKTTLMRQPWHLTSVTTGVQICEGSRVIVYIGEPNSADHGPHRSKDVMERANLLLATPKLLAACKMALEDLTIWHDESRPYQDSVGGIGYRGCEGCTTCQETLPQLRAAIAQAEGVE